MEAKDGYRLARLGHKKFTNGQGPKELTKLLSKQSRQRIGIDFEKQMTKLLENKTIPHVIAVIEGKHEKSKFTISTTIGEEAKSIPYTRVAYVQGTNAKGASDNKQSMSIYVRDDMREVYSISHETVGWNQLKKIVLTPPFIKTVSLGYISC